MRISIRVCGRSFHAERKSNNVTEIVLLGNVCYNTSENFVLNYKNKYRNTRIVRRKKWKTKKSTNTNHNTYSERPNKNPVKGIRNTGLALPVDANKVAQLRFSAIIRYRESPEIGSNGRDSNIQVQYVSTVFSVVQIST